MLQRAHVFHFLQVAGLGERADEVVFKGGRGVFCEAMDQRAGGKAISIRLAGKRQHSHFLAILHGTHPRISL